MKSGCFSDFPGFVRMHLGTTWKQFLGLDRNRLIHKLVSNVDRVPQDYSKHSKSLETLMNGHDF